MKVPLIIDGTQDEKGKDEYKRRYREANPNPYRPHGPTWILRRLSKGIDVQFRLPFRCLIRRPGLLLITVLGDMLLNLGSLFLFCLIVHIS
jgi:hypothetical protein